MGVLANVAATLGACIPGLLVHEFSACAPAWAKRIIRRAARGLPEEKRIACEAEWLAHLDDVPGNVSKMIHATQLWQMVLVSRIKLVDRERLYRAFEAGFPPLIFVMSLGGTAIDYFRGLPAGTLVIDVMPAVAFVAVVVVRTLISFITGRYQAWRGRGKTREADDTSVEATK